MKRYRIALGIAVFACAAILIGQTSPNGCVTPPAPVPKTGQTTVYAIGDDGYLQKGVAWPDPRFTDNGNGTATDNLTGLIWMQDANCDGTKTWYEALDYCNALADGICDLTDGSSVAQWHLPNVKELHSLVDYGNYNPALPTGHPFTGVRSGKDDFYWASTSSASWDVDAWRVRFFWGDIGDIASSSKKITPYYAWCVRDGQ